jgi:hypothetical protein
MIHDIISGVIGAILSIILATGIELWRARGRRRLYGEWWCAIQPVYYKTKKWHVQRVRIKPGIFGVVVVTEPESGKLQWKMYARLENQKFLVGRWESSRPGSISNGYMSVQLSSNGTYMCGHDYANVHRNNESDFGVLLFGRSRDDLESARKAVRSGVRELLPLADEVDFPDDQSSG